MTNFEYLKSLNQNELAEFLTVLSSAKNIYGKYNYFDPITNQEDNNKDKVIKDFVRWLNNEVIIKSDEHKIDSDKSAAVSFSKMNMPYKSQIITLNLDGIDRQYRVLKVNGNNAEILAMFDVTTSTFGSSQLYQGSTLDTYLNTTWYETLTDTAKAAIVDKTFNQDSWYLDGSGNPDYSGYYGSTKPGASTYTISLGNATSGSEITRHIYALSVKDVIDYVTDTSFGCDRLLQNYNIWKMFWNDEVSHSENYPWLRSASAGSNSGAWGVNGDDGSLDYDSISTSYTVRPALTIDLSKISWS